MPLQHLFGDTLQLKPGSPSYDYMTETWRIPPCPDIMVAGFPCVDLSLLNCKDVLFDFLNPENSGVSGQVLHGILDLVKVWKPKAVMLENVVGLKRPRTKKVAHDHDCPEQKEPVESPLDKL